MPPFSSPQGNAPQTLAALWSLAFVAMVFVCLRLYTRYRVVDAIGTDDHLLNTAFVLLVAYCVIITISAFYGFGLIRDDVPNPWHRSLVIILTGVGQTVIGLAVWVSKSSLAFTLLRLFGQCGHGVRSAIIVPPVLLGLFVAAGLLAFWTECRPVSYLWDRLNPEGVCGSYAVYLTLVASALSFLCDFLYAALPWWVLKGIQMRKYEKRIVLYSLSLGVFAGGCGVMRAVTLPSMAEGEYMRDRASLLIWHAAEMTVTIVCISIPVCRPLWKNWFDALLPEPSTPDDEGSEGALAWPRQQYTIGGSEMVYTNASKDTGSTTARSKGGRKGSKASHRSEQPGGPPRKGSWASEGCIQVPGKIVQVLHTSRESGPISFHA